MHRRDIWRITLRTLCKTIIMLLPAFFEGGGSLWAQIWDSRGRRQQPLLVSETRLIALSCSIKMCAQRIVWFCHKGREWQTDRQNYDSQDRASIAACAVKTTTNCRRFMYSQSHECFISVVRPRRPRSAAAYSRQTFPWTICRSVGLSVCPVHCGKTADRIRIPFGIVGRTGPGMRQVVGFRDRSTGRGTFGGEFGARHCTKRAFTAYACYSAATRPSSRITLGRLVAIAAVWLMLPAVLRICQQLAQINVQLQSWSLEKCTALS